MTIHYLREAHLSLLKTGIEANFPRYQAQSPWLDDLFGGESYSLPSNFLMPEVKLQLGKEAHNDLHNSKIVHQAFRNLTLTEASNEQLWAYLAHVTFWEYMISRWPAVAHDEQGFDDDSDDDEESKTNRKKDPFTVVRNRYFFNGGRSLVRHGIARLWWYGFATYDPNRGNPYELTEVLLKNQDLAQNLMERSFSRNIMILRTILSLLHKEGQSDDRWFQRKYYREVIKHINHTGGVTVLDALDVPDIETVVKNGMESVALSFTEG
ncbi:hypothetical protein CIG75_07305 [Tumebacillus algifaecis]|uniref:Uncharacterized protein n=1 Tax=Tumebacillus algifaecis TaxID=1214604 RepID=A0A223D065_9BACL|nr:DUF6339 family protein [Tumebacillus algifaecis]ASS74803.1 hypothetical protein CIG75_07305 [Tumebacillus algifaecis]